MTTPGGSAPDGAYVLGSAFGQDVTEESAKAMYQGDAISGFEVAQVDLWGLIVDLAIQWIDSMIVELLWLLDDLDFLGIFGFGSLAQQMTNTKTTANNAQSTATTAQSQADAAAAAAAAAAAEAAASQAASASQGIVVKQVQVDVATLAGNVPIGSAWDSMVPGTQTSFPQMLLNTAVKNVGASSAAGANSFIVLDSGSNTETLYYGTEPVYTPAKNSVESTYILSKYAGGRATITFDVDSVTTPCSLHAGLMRMLPNGDLKVEWVSPDQTPLMTTARAEWTVTTPTDLPFEAGEWMAPFIHQVGTGNVRPLMGIKMSNISRGAGVFPPQQKMTFTSSSALTAGSTVAKASQVFTSLTVPWLAVGLRLFTGDPVPRTAFDDFNRPSAVGAPLGPSWAIATAAVPQLWNNAFSPKAYDYTDGWHAFNGEGRALYAQPLAYSENRVTAAVIGTPSATRNQRIVYWSNAAGDTYCALSILSGTVTLHKVSGGTFTTLSSSAVTTAANDVWKIETGQDVDGKWVHVASKQAGGAGAFAPLLSYTDTAGSIATGATQRYTGLAVTGNGSSGTSGEFNWFQSEDTVQTA